MGWSWSQSRFHNMWNNFGYSALETQIHEPGAMENENKWSSINFSSQIMAGSGYFFHFSGRTRRVIIWSGCTNSQLGVSVGRYPFFSEGAFENKKITQKRQKLKNYSHKTFRLFCFSLNPILMIRNYEMDNLITENYETPKFHHFE